LASLNVPNVHCAIIIRHDHIILTPLHSSKLNWYTAYGNLLPSVFLFISFRFQ
jgi:hypothetical protein